MKRDAAAERALQERLGHVFDDQTLLGRALTHSSALGSADRAQSYQRLEFLGDRVLGLAVADMLIREFPTATEGDLSRRLADLVRASTCAAVARAMGLQDVIYLGLGKGAKSGKATDDAAKLTQTILADACEAVVGAVYLDGGYAPAAALVERYWKQQLLTPAQPLRDPKTALQEWAQGRGLPTPQYQEISRKGPHHNPEFRVAVSLPDHPAAEGVGRSKRAAEQAAAASMLARHGVAQDQD